MRDRVTISVDSALKRAYEDMFGKEYSETLEEAMKKKMLESGRVETYEAVIRIVDREQEERRHTLAKMKVDLERIEFVKKSNDQEIADLREEKFQKDKASFLRMIKTSTKPNWNYIMVEYHFNREIDAERYYLSRIRKELEST
jgi:hypothetical protein